MEWRCANCGRPAASEEDPCDSCGHDEFERSVVRLRWECTACGTRNAERDSACRNCGLSEYVEVEPDEPPDATAGGEGGQSGGYIEWQCTECGTGHPRNTPPCRRCGNMRFEQVQVESREVGDYVPSSGWLDVELRYLAGIVLVVGFVVLAGLGVVPLPGDGPLAGVDVNTTAVEAGIHEELTVERGAVDNDPTILSPGLSAAAAAHARAMADDGELSTLRAGDATVVDRIDEAGVSCETPATVVGRQGSLDRFDGPSDVAGWIVDGWLGRSDNRQLLLGANVERSGVGVVLDDGQLWVTWVGC